MSGSACRGCGGDNPPDDAFCGFCGLRLVALEVASEVAPEAWSCRECGATGRPGTAYCGTCGARWGGTRVDDLRLVTALFADISGFTTLADTLETEDLHDVINPLIGGLARIAEKYDGFITKYAGDALLVLYGAPVAHEDDAQRALLTALEMHAALPTLLEQIGPAVSHLTIHVGVNTGKVVAGRVGSDAQADYSVLGDSVILAQRLESVCPSGQTYVGPATYELCKAEFDFESVGELTLKGKLKPVEGYRLVGRRRAGTGTGRPLVGRSGELAVVDEVLDAVEAGRGVLLALSGEPGSGKSRLLAEARTRATGRGVRWLSARCLSYGSSLPYWPFADLLRQALGLRVEDPAEETRARLWDVLPSATMVGAERLLGLPVEQVGPEQARREVHDALASWLTMLAERSPVVLSIEDTHWADSASMDVLGELVRTTGGHGVGLVVTCRPEGVDPIESLGAETDYHYLAVGPLSEHAVAELAGDVLGLPVGPALLELLVERTLGNPLFVEELARSLQETGALVDTSAGADLRPGYDLTEVPGSVERVFNARVDALPPHALELLSTCSVIGRSSRVSLISAVVDDDPRPTLELLAELGMLDTVVDSDEPALAFHHALLHDVVYSRILRRQKRALHRRVADVGRRLYGDSDITIELLARHLYLADAGEEAVEPLLRAGRRAVQLYANDTAAENFARAVEVLQGLDDPARLAAVSCELALVQERRGAYDEAIVAFDAARRGGEVRAWTGAAEVLAKLGRYDEALSLLGSSPGADDLAVLLERCRVHFAASQPVEALEAVRAGLRVVGDDARRKADLLVELVRIEADSEHPHFAVSHGRKAIALLEELGDLRQLSAVLRLVGDAYVRQDLLTEASAHLERSAALAARTGYVEQAAAALLSLAIVEARRERYDEALAASGEALAIAERVGHKPGTAACLVNIADFLVRAGRLDDALPAAARARRFAESVGQAHVLAMALVTEAQLHEKRGETASAREAALRARSTATSLSYAEAVDDADAVLARLALVSADEGADPRGPRPRLAD